MVSVTYFLNKIKDVRPRDCFAVFPMLGALALSPFYKRRNRDTWLVCERCDEARDNGYWFFKKMRENHPEQRCVYAIDMKSADYQKVRDLGEVVRFGSLRHWLLYFTCAHTISSQKGGKPNAALCAFLELNGLFDSHMVFMQHGVIINQLEWLHADRSRFDMFVTSVRPEHQFVKNSFGYENGVVQLTGLPRFDNLHDNYVKENRIVIMPTWRSWLALKSQGRSGLESDFMRSRYLREWKALLESPRLNRIIEEHGLEVIFYPHSNMQPHLDDFKRELQTNVIIADWESWDLPELLKSSEMMVTDYSSVFFDMVYMKKPVLFYQFDQEDFRKGQYGKGWFDYADNPFADAYLDADGLLDALESQVKNRFAVAPEYLAAHARCFPYYDTDNSERVYDRVRALDAMRDVER